jgi:CarboxypepD_reg-like domain
MIKHIVIFLFSLYFTNSHAQSWTGTLTDELGQSLSYVNVAVVRTQVGTFSDELGHYSIDTNIMQPSDEVVFSHLGYNEVRIKFATLRQQTGAVVMRARDYQMREVVILPRDARSMMLDALAAVKDNYPDEFTKQEIVFKDYSMRNGKRSHYGYFHFDMYVPSYARYDSLHTYTTVRDYALYERSKELFTASMSPDNLLPFIFPSHTFNKDWIDRHEFSMAGTTAYQGDTLDVIRFKLLPKAKEDFIAGIGIIYIDQRDKAIRYVQFDLSSAHSKRFFLVAKLDTMMVHIQVAYRKTDGKYMLDYATQKTYAQGKLFGGAQNLRYSTTMRGLATIPHLKANQIVMRNEVRDLVLTLKPKEIDQMKEEPDMK